MAELKSNFEGLADNYSQNRPQYPQRLVGKLNELLPDGALAVADIAAGTGISTRVLAKALGERAAITGVEPSEDMRRRAIADTEGRPNIRYAAGTAETLDFADAALDLIFVGQALHWFDRPAFYGEAGRTLKPGGIVAVARNSRNWRKSPFLVEYEEFHEKYRPGFTRIERDLDVAGELAALGWIAGTVDFDEEWVRPMKVDTFLGMAQSSSKVTTALRKIGWEEGMRQLAAMAERHVGDDGFLVLPYVSVMVCGVKVK